MINENIIKKHKYYKLFIIYYDIIIILFEIFLSIREKNSQRIKIK